MPRPRTRSDDEILDAAHRVILARGPHDFTLLHVGEAVGLSPATLIQRFKSKRGLILAFSRRSAAAEADALESDGAAGLSSVRSALLRLAKDVDDRNRFANSMALLLEDVRDPELRAIARRQAEARERAIAKRLLEAQRRGEIVRCDAARLARVVYTAWNGAMIQWALRGRGSLVTWVGAGIDAVLAPYVSRAGGRGISRPASSGRA